MSELPEVSVLPKPFKHFPLGEVGPMNRLERNLMRDVYKDCRTTIKSQVNDLAKIGI